MRYAGESRLSLDTQPHHARGRSHVAVPHRHDRGRSAGMSSRLFDLAKTIRSKNAGVDRITFDVIFTDRADYDRVRAAEPCRATRSAACSASRLTGSPIASRSSRRWRSSSPFAARVPAAALAMATSSAASNMGRCSIWKYPSQANSRRADRCMMVGGQQESTENSHTQAHCHHGRQHLASSPIDAGAVP